TKAQWRSEPSRQGACPFRPVQVVANFSPRIALLQSLPTECKCEGIPELLRISHAWPRNDALQAHALASQVPLHASSASEGRTDTCIDHSYQGWLRASLC